MVGSKLPRKSPIQERPSLPVHAIATKNIDFPTSCGIATFHQGYFAAPSGTTNASSGIGVAAAKNAAILADKIGDAKALTDAFN
ncbi:MAG: hypothetical protein ACFFB7_04025, partial [Candidatus Sifarchaeia archaeon]